MPRIAVGKITPTPRGTYIRDTQYNYLDMVVNPNDGNSYICNVHNAPVGEILESSQYWVKSSDGNARQAKIEADISQLNQNKANEFNYEYGNVSIGITYDEKGHWLIATTDDLQYKVIKKLPTNLGLGHPCYNCSMYYKNGVYYILTGYVNKSASSYNIIKNLIDGNEPFTNTPMVLTTIDFETFNEHLIEYDTTLYWSMNAGSWFVANNGDIYLANLVTDVNAPVRTDVWGVKTVQTRPIFSKFNLDTFKIENIISSNIILDETHYYMDQSLIYGTDGKIYCFIKNEYYKTIATYTFASIGDVPVRLYDDITRLYVEEVCHVRKVTNPKNGFPTYALFTDCYARNFYGVRLFSVLSEALRNPTQITTDTNMTYRAVRDVTIPINEPIFTKLLIDIGYSKANLFSPFFRTDKYIFQTNGAVLSAKHEKLVISEVYYLTNINIPVGTFYMIFSVASEMTQGTRLFTFPFQVTHPYIFTGTNGLELLLRQNGDLVVYNTVSTGIFYRVSGVYGFAPSF